MEETIITKVVHSILVASAVIGNILVCLVVLKTKTFRTPVYYLIMNLAIADLMIVTSFTPRHILEGLYHHPSGMEGEILCKTITSDTFTWVGAVASSITLVAIAYERFAAVKSPLAYYGNRRSHFTNKKLKIVLVFCWIFAVIFNIPLFWVRKLNHERGFCESHWPSVAFALSYNVTWLVLIGVLPFCLMAFFYGKVIAKLHKQAVPGGNMLMASKKKITKMLMTITVIYGVCWIPNLILYVVWYFVLEAYVMYTINKVFLVLILVNSCANPIVYAAQDNLFRSRMAGILCKCRKRSGNQSGMSTIFQKSRGGTGTCNIQLVRLVHRTSNARELEFCNLKACRSRKQLENFSPEIRKQCNSVPNVRQRSDTGIMAFCNLGVCESKESLDEFSLKFNRKRERIPDTQLRDGHSEWKE